MSTSDTLRHCRPAVIRWALELEGRLKTRDDKYPAWEDQDFKELMEHFVSERSEVDEVLSRYFYRVEMRGEAAEHYRKDPVDELLDEAAISLMLRDRLEEWNPEMYQRGRLI